MQENENTLSVSNLNPIVAQNLNDEALNVFSTSNACSVYSYLSQVQYKNAFRFLVKTLNKVQTKLAIFRNLVDLCDTSTVDKLYSLQMQVINSLVHSKDWNASLKTDMSWDKKIATFTKYLVTSNEKASTTINYPYDKAYYNLLAHQLEAFPPDKTSLNILAQKVNSPNHPFYYIDNPYVKALYAVEILLLKQDVSYVMKRIVVLWYFEFVKIRTQDVEKSINMLSKFISHRNSSPTDKILAAYNTITFFEIEDYAPVRAFRFIGILEDIENFTLDTPKEKSREIVTKAIQFFKPSAKSYDDVYEEANKLSKNIPPKLRDKYNVYNLWTLSHLYLHLHYGNPEINKQIKSIEF